LDDSLNPPLTLISAPAGFGKSTLVNQSVYANQAAAEFADRNGSIDHAAWLSLDEE